MVEMLLLIFLTHCSNTKKLDGSESLKKPVSVEYDKKRNMKDFVPNKNEQSIGKFTHQEITSMA